MTILIVDDYRPSRVLVNKVMGREGFRVCEACDGFEALEVLAREPIDAILSDILMPNMDGYRLCTEVRRSEKFGDLPFIFYTSNYISASDEARALELGADKFIRKPASREVIVLAVRELISGPRRVHATITPRKEADSTGEYTQRLVQKLEERNDELLLRTQELRETSEKLQAIIRAAPVAIMSFDQTGRVTSWNPAAERIFGWSEAEVLGQRPRHVGAEDREEFERLRQRVHAGEAIMGLQVRRCRRDGTQVDLELNAAPLKDADGNVVGKMAVLAAVTDRKKAEELAARSRDFHQALFDDFPTLVWRSGTDAKCCYFNRTWLEFTGRTLEQELGDGWTQGVHPGDLEKTVKNYLDAFHARQPFQIDYRLRRRDGTYREILDYGRPFLDAEGCFAGYLGSCYDITDRKGAEARLTKSEALLAEAQALARIGSWERDIRTNVVSWSDEMFRIMGLRPQERVVSFPYFLSRVNAEDRAHIDQVVQQALRDHQPYEFEYRAALPDGMTRIHHVHGVVITDEQGRPVRLHGTTQDITAQSLAREALRQSEQRFAAFMDNLPTFAWMKDLEGRYVYANKVTEQLPEYRSGWKGKTDADMLPGSVAAEYRANDQKVITSGQPIQTVEHYQTEDETRHMLVSKFPIFDQKGAIVMVGGACVEITQRIRAKEALRESEERFRQLAENIDEVVWIRNVERWHLEFVNAAYERIWKRSVEGLHREPNSWMEAIHPDDRERLTPVAEQLLAKGECDVTYRIVWPDGAIRWIRDRAFPIRNAQGKLIRIAGIAEDITERKRAEQQVENFAEMLKILTNRLFEAQEEERRHLARELHDEIGQSLTAAKLDIEAAKQLNDPAARALRLDDSLAVIENLLESVRALSLDLRPPLLDEVGLAAALRAHAQTQAVRGGLTLRLAVDESLPRCDPAVEIACFRVAQEALTNVLRHAHAKTVEMEVRRCGDELELRVRDDGVGFDVGVASARAASGESYGLLSMRERVNLAGGTFVCKSISGQGTEIEAHFLLTLIRTENRYEKASRRSGG